MNVGFEDINAHKYFTLFESKYPLLYKSLIFNLATIGILNTFFDLKLLVCEYLNNL